MRLLCLALALAATPALSGGLDDVPPYEEPCAVPMPTEADYKSRVFGMDPDEAWRMALTLRAAACGDVEPPQPLWMQWREKGFTDHDIMVFVFDGPEIEPTPPPAVVPLPAAAYLLAAALGALALLKIKTRDERNDYVV